MTGAVGVDAPLLPAPHPYLSISPFPSVLSSTYPPLFSSLFPPLTATFGVPVPAFPSCSTSKVGGGQGALELLLSHSRWEQRQQQRQWPNSCSLPCSFLGAAFQIRRNHGAAEPTHSHCCCALLSLPPAALELLAIQSLQFISQQGGATELLQPWKYKGRKGEMGGEGTCY